VAKKLNFALKNADGSTQMTWHIRTFIAVIGMVAVMVLFPASAQAGEILRAGGIPAGQVIENDVFLTGQQPVVDGTVNGDVFIVGADATISGEVNGSVFVLAETLNLPGSVNGNLYATAVELTQPAEGEIGRNLYALVLSLVTETESSIGRDLTTVAMSASLRGQTERNTTAIIGPWELFKILRDSFNQNIVGFIPDQPSLAKRNTEIISLHTVSPHRAMRRVAQATDSSVLVDWLLASLQSFLKFLIVGGLMLWAFPSQFQGWVEKVQKEPLASAGYGAIVLINGYLMPVLALFLLIGLLLGLLYLSLSSLAWMSLWAGLGLLMTFFTLFLAATTFLSKAIVAYLAGTFILSRLASGAMQYRILPLLLGLLIYVLLASIPYVGFVIGLVVTLFGLGAIWLAHKQSPRPLEAVEEAP